MGEAGRADLVMSAGDWERRWAEGKTGWHKAEFHADLTRHLLPALGEARPLAFVPLCGKSRDLEWLLAQGFAVAGAELSEAAVRDFFKEAGLALAEPEVRGAFRLFATPDGKLRIFVGDAFQLGPAEVAGAGAVWDRGSLVAINVEDRRRYVEMLERVTVAGAVVLLASVDYDPAKYGGPPHQLSAADVRELFKEPRWKAELLEERDGSDEKTRDTWGLDWFTERCWAIKRLA